MVLIESNMWVNAAKGRSQIRALFNGESIIIPRKKASFVPNSDVKMGIS
jgi:hypothetical protein